MCGPKKQDEYITISFIIRSLEEKNALAGYSQARLIDIYLIALSFLCSGSWREASPVAP
jgi:hypothetical protein